MEDILSDQTLSLLTNQSFWINTAIVVGGTLIIYWVLRSLIAFISTRRALQRASLIALLQYRR